MSATLSTAIIPWNIQSVHQHTSQILKKNLDVSVEVKGHADELGVEDYNMKLSEKRAKAVYDFLTVSVVGESQISFKGYGEGTWVIKRLLKHGK